MEFQRWRNFYLNCFNYFVQHIFYFDNEYIIRKGYKSGFWKTSNYQFRYKCNINISHFKPKILEAIDHLKGISHKRPDVDSIFDFISRTTASNIAKEVLAGIITDLLKQNIIINKKSINERDWFRRNTLEAFSTPD